MDKELRQIISNYSSRDASTKKNWYSSAATHYLKARPTYPDEIIDHINAITPLIQKTSILEIGCGPGTATQSFAARGCQIDAVEPNQDFVHLARNQCQSYPEVTIHPVSFEDYESDANQFDIVLAATSFHWVDQSVAYKKSAELLKDNGHLVLLWNKELQPDRAIYDQFEAAYETHAPGLRRFETKQQEIAVLKNLEAPIIESGLFTLIDTGFIQTNVDYSSDDYIALLNSYSPYIELNAEHQAQLFHKITDYINTELSGVIHLSYMTGYHIAKKMTG